MNKKQAADSNVNIILNREFRSRVFPAALTEELDGLEMPARVEGNKFKVTGDDFRKVVSQVRPDIYRRMEVHEPRLKDIVTITLDSHMATIVATVNGRSVVRKRSNAHQGEEEATA